MLHMLGVYYSNILSYKWLYFCFKKTKKKNHGLPAKENQS